MIAATRTIEKGKSFHFRFTRNPSLNICLLDNIGSSTIIIHNHLEKNRRKEESTATSN